MAPAPETSSDLERFRAYRTTGDRSIRNELVESNARLAEIYVRRYRGRGVPTDDLRQVAMLAILKAVERFDPEMGIKFSTFASRTIEGECKRYFRDRTWSVRPPRRSQELHLALRRADENLNHRLGRSPTVPELAAEVDESIEHVIEALEAGSAHRAVSIDRPAVGGEPGDGPAPSRSLPTMEPGYGDVENQLLIHGLLDELDERDRLVVHLRFFEGQTQDVIAETLGVSQSYLSRILRRVLLDLRSRLGADETPEPS